MKARDADIEKHSEIALYETVEGVGRVLVWTPFVSVSHKEGITAFDIGKGEDWIQGMVSDKEVELR